MPNEIPDAPEPSPSPEPQRNPAPSGGSEPAPAVTVGPTIHPTTGPSINPTIDPSIPGPTIAVSVSASASPSASPSPSASASPSPSPSPNGSPGPSASSGPQPSPSSSPGASGGVSPSPTGNPPSPSPTPSPPPACGATLRFLDSQNGPIDPSVKALNVSNHVSNDAALSTTFSFSGTSTDPDNFRIEVTETHAAGSTITATLQAGLRPPISYTLRLDPLGTSGNVYRSTFLRLVTDGPDDAVVGNQTILCKLGETVVFKYTKPACEDRLEIQIGRPSNENNNGSDQLLHDIRNLKLNVVVFSRPGSTRLDGAINATVTTIKVDSVADAHQSGHIRIDSEFIEYNGLNLTTNEFLNCTRGVDGSVAASHVDNSRTVYSRRVPSVARSQVEADLATVDERLAQSAIRVATGASIDMGGAGDPGVALPSPLLDGFTYTPGVISTFNADEIAVIAKKDADHNSIDTFYVEAITQGDRGQAYPATRNQTGNPAGDNFVVIAANEGPVTLAHEVMHILLDSAHRADPSVALFRSPTTTKAVTGTKRIGPFPSDGPGTTDTATIRAAAENLP